MTGCRYARGLISGPGSTLFEELGLYYIGPIDGHNLGDLIGVLRGARQQHAFLPSVTISRQKQSRCIHMLDCKHGRNGCEVRRTAPFEKAQRWLQLADTVPMLGAEVKDTKTVGPVLIHVITDKGRGYDPSLTAADRMHGVTKFDPRTGKQVKGKSTVSAAAYGYSLLHVSLQLCRRFHVECITAAMPCITCIHTWMILTQRGHLLARLAI